MWAKKRKFTLKQVPEFDKLSYDYLIKFYTKTGKLRNEKHVPTIPGLCLTLGMAKTTFYEYGAKPEHEPFHNSVARLRLIIEDSNLQAGYRGNTFASFVASRKFGYVEQQKLKVETDKSSIALFAKYNRMSDEDFQKELENELKG